jgi:hypothetical protein
VGGCNATCGLQSRTEDHLVVDESGFVGVLQTADGPAAHDTCRRPPKVLGALCACDPSGEAGVCAGWLVLHKVFGWRATGRSRPKRLRMECRGAAAKWLGQMLCTRNRGASAVVL